MSSPAPTAFPALPGKHALPSLTDPAEHAAYIRSRHPGADLSPYLGTVLLYQDRLLRQAARDVALRPLGRWVSGELHALGNGVVLCSGFGRGAPAAALVVEQLIALGIGSIITVGTAAALHPELAPGSIVVCERALRDEGLSHHYRPPSRFAEPDRPLTDRLAAALAGTQAVRIGGTWTTDALYRETEAEVSRYATEGLLTADMEAAAVLTVAEYRSASAAAAFAVADSLAQRTPRRHLPSTDDALAVLLHAAIRTFTQAPPSEHASDLVRPADPGPDKNRATG
ncbi:nucleoside phosphorylase [Kitasatospora sp. NPDC059088]|uniref:nucleoside phosphorylase n=1 Tax=Kitasatospora sp. NPDC059088 TaxID=3346722 RepID=UPI00369BF401